MAMVHQPFRWIIAPIPIENLEEELASLLLLLCLCAFALAMRIRRLKFLFASFITSFAYLLHEVLGFECLIWIRSRMYAVAWSRMSKNTCPKAITFEMQFLRICKVHSCCCERLTIQTTNTSINTFNIQKPLYTTVTTLIRDALNQITNNLFRNLYIARDWKSWLPNCNNYII